MIGGRMNKDTSLNEIGKCAVPMRRMDLRHLRTGLLPILIWGGRHKQRHLMQIRNM